jgi:coenzyme F420 hydrogenase subunit beta
MVIKGREDFINTYTASGGFVTSFLTYLLDKKHVEGIINVRLNGENPRGAKCQFITDPSQFCNSSGSIYYAIPLGNALKIASKKQGKFAVVGLPCQIRGINKLRKFESYKNKISVTVSLFCGFMVGIHGTEYLLNSLKIPKGTKIRKISFRAKRHGRDGFLVETNKEEYFVERGDYTSLLNRLFSYKRCLMCNDMTGEQADISCGDARKKFGENQTLVVSRNKSLTSIVYNAVEDGYLHMSGTLSADDVFSTQRRILKYKKETIGQRLRLMRMINRHIPICEDRVYSQFSPDKGQKFRSVFFVLTCLLTQNDMLRNQLLSRIPKSVLRHYASRIYP